MNKSMAYIIRFLRLFCPPHLLEEIEGDLMQRYEKDMTALGEKRANRKLLWNAIRYCRPGILLRHRNRIKTNVTPMFFHNLRFGVRHLLSNPMNSIIHIVGLTLGIAVCLTLGLLLRHELTYDAYHENGKRIFRVNSSFANQDFSIYATPVLLADEIRQHTSGTQHVAMALPQFESNIWISPERVFKQDRIIIAEPELIDIFNFEPIVGNLCKALQKPYTALLSESTALKFFGDENPIGKSFRLRSEFNITVEGVFKDLPPNTNLPANVILSFVNNEKYLNNGDTWYFGHIPWVKLQACTYVLLQEGIASHIFQTQLDRIAEKNINSSSEVDQDVKCQFSLQQLSRIHLEPEFRNPWVRPIQSKWIWFFGSIGIIILALACVNFLNLSTAQAITRIKEVGIRKVVGARPSQLIQQLLSETMLLVSIAWVVSLVLVKILLPFINTLIEKQLSLNLWSPQFLIVVAASIMVVSLLSGIYPAWVIARFKPTSILKGGRSSTGKPTLRKALVMFQLSISMILLVVVVVTTQQVNYLRNLDYGAATKNVVGVEIPSIRKGEAFASELVNIRGVNTVSLARAQAVNDDHWWNGIGATEDSPTIPACVIHADSQYLDVYGLKLISGSTPSPINDSTARGVNKVIVNENLLKTLELGSAEEAIGKRFHWAGITEITGVIADFNTEPLRYSLSPTVIIPDSSLYSMACIRLVPGSDIEFVTQNIEALWKKTFPDEVFNLKILDEQVDEFYRSEEQLISVFKIFAGIAIFISCLGIWGLASFDTLHKSQEISIRKVLGATISGIVQLISGPFLKLTLISCVISLPFCYLGISRFLDLFAYKINVDWRFYALPATFILILTMSTISVLTITAALANPAKNLRNE